MHHFMLTIKTQISGFLRNKIGRLDNIGPIWPNITGTEYSLSLFSKAHTVQFPTDLTQLSNSVHPFGSN